MMTTSISPSVGDYAFSTSADDPRLYFIGDTDIYKGDEMIYTVRIQDANGGGTKYYVGSTTRGKERLLDHTIPERGRCAEFVKRSVVPESTVSMTAHRFACKGDQDCDMHQAETREAQIRAMLHGIKNVSGGEVTSRQDASTTKRSICHQANLCQKCGLPGHYAGGCTTPPGRAAAWFALFDGGSSSSGGDALSPVDWDIERALYIRHEAELCQESTFRAKTDIGEWMGFQAQIFLGKREITSCLQDHYHNPNPYQRKLFYLCSLPDTESTSVMKSTIAANKDEINNHITHFTTNNICKHGEGRMREYLQNFILVAQPIIVQENGKAEDLYITAGPLQCDRHRGARIGAPSCPLRPGDRKVCVNVPTVTGAQRMRQAAFARAWYHDSLREKRKREEDGAQITPVKLCRGESPFVDLSSCHQAWTEDNVPPPPYARRFEFVSDGTSMLVSAGALSLVPGSKLDDLAREHPTTSHVPWDQSRQLPANYYAGYAGFRRYYNPREREGLIISHPPIYVDYDKTAFEYIIARINQLRCHHRIESADDFPNATSATIPSTVDHHSVSVLSQCLGLSAFFNGRHDEN